MNTPSCPWRRWVCYALSASSLTLTTFAVFGQDREARVSEQKVKAVAQMVDALANRNPPPKLVQVHRDRHAARLPLFPKDYDWDEQERVLHALSELHGDKRIELWEELVRKANDSRYSLTLLVENGEYPFNRTVGYFCRRLAYWRLLGVFRQHLPPKKSPVKRTIYLNVGLKDLVEWRKERKDKSLYELQIEVCEKALPELAKVEGVSQVKIDAARKKIELEIQKLKRTKQPVFLKYNISFEGQEPYSPGHAKRLRKELKRKKLNK